MLQETQHQALHVPVDSPVEPMGGSPQASSLDALQSLVAENQQLRAERDHALLAVGIAEAALAQALRVSGTDALTSLPNRMVLQQRLSHDMALTERTNSPLLLLYIDVDDFKLVNDAYGHSVGDALLQEIAARLLSSVRVSDSVCRVGGDEFVVVMPLIVQEEADRLARTVAEAVELPLLIEGHQLLPRVSVGLALYPRDGRTPEALIRSADAHMYQVKRTRHRSG